MSKTYEIENLRDILDIPEDRIDDFLVEFKTWYEMAHSTKDLLNATAEAMGVPATAEALGKMKWIDDGKWDITANIIPQVNGVPNE